ncbi:uncharacterized protein LOC123500584 [Portunus trituberculatus]|uniref:uncharacterized protein LOC123500584 n=1 Tax=Portunus trituberculatus TaxID=210409 RepID=UPI001E1CF989|nr:uncharacterized protein LOC123500584 [Portunus trituberculatus]
MWRSGGMVKGQVNGLASPADWRVGCGRILVTLEWTGGRVVHLCRYYSGLLEAVDGWIRDGVFMLWGRCVYLPCLGSSLRDICVVNTVESLPNKRTDATALLMPWRNNSTVRHGRAQVGARGGQGSLHQEVQHTTRKVG